MREFWFSIRQWVEQILGRPSPSISAVEKFSADLSVEGIAQSNEVIWNRLTASQKGIANNLAKGVHVGCPVPPDFD